MHIKQSEIKKNFFLKNQSDARLFLIIKKQYNIFNAHYHSNSIKTKY